MISRTDFGYLFQFKNIRINVGRRLFAIAWGKYEVTCTTTGGINICFWRGWERTVLVSI